jgi:sphingosine kinase
MLRALAGAAKGESFWLPKVTQISSVRRFLMPRQLHYIKARAYRIEALKSRGNLSVDGEAMPFENFQVEVQAKLATLLSLYGYYVADFPPSETKRQKKSAGN